MEELKIENQEDIDTRDWLCDRVNKLFDNWEVSRISIGRSASPTDPSSVLVNTVFERDGWAYTQSPPRVGSRWQSCVESREIADSIEHILYDKELYKYYSINVTVGDETIPFDEFYKRLYGMKPTDESNLTIHILRRVTEYLQERHDSYSYRARSNMNAWVVSDVVFGREITFNKVDVDNRIMSYWTFMNGNTECIISDHFLFGYMDWVAINGGRLHCVNDFGVYIEATNPHDASNGFEKVYGADVSMLLGQIYQFICSNKKGCTISVRSRSSIIASTLFTVRPKNGNDDRMVVEFGHYTVSDGGLCINEAANIIVANAIASIAKANPDGILRNDFSFYGLPLK